VPTTASVFVALLAGVAQPAATGKRPMTAVDLLQVPVLGSPELSPDGRRAVFVLEEADWKADEQVGHVWRVDASGSQPLQLTRGSGESSPRWSPHGTWIAFLAKRGDDAHDQVYLLDDRGGEARRLTGHATAVSRIAWSPDAGAVYFLADDEKSAAEKQRDEANDGVFAFDESWKHRHLWRVSVPEGRESRVTGGDFSVLAYTPSRDGERIVLHRGPSPLFDDADESEVWTVASHGSDARQLTRNGVWEQGGELSPDGETVLFVAAAGAAFEPYYNDNLFTVPAAGGEPRLLLPDEPFEVQQARWSEDGRHIYFTANTGARAQLFVTDASGETLAALSEGDHNLRRWSYTPGAGHVFALDMPANPGDLWRLAESAIEAQEAPLRVTRVFEDLAERFELPRQELIRWTGADGVAVEGLLLYPIGYAPGQRYPLIVQTHGGPASSDRFGFGWWGSYAPVATALGYAILRPNYRGSSGYGDPFLRDMVGHYFNQGHLDVMRGIDHVIEMGLADPDRLVKMGWSAGGHMTNKIITHTDRFKAASSGAGAVNWVSMYGQSDVRIYRTPWFGGTPWQEDAPIGVYWEQSPIKDVHRVKTPTLVLVGENDVRVPMAQSVELYRALRSHGVPTHLYVAPREPHGWRELRHRLFKINAELEWFERHARGREYTWEQAPSPPAETPD
jgi:dipeptidyl aminopeptidase/acylaminoacyl peptidase